MPIQTVGSPRSGGCRNLFPQTPLSNHVRKLRATQLILGDILADRHATTYYCVRTWQSHFHETFLYDVVLMVTSDWPRAKPFSSSLVSRVPSNIHGIAISWI